MNYVLFTASGGVFDIFIGLLQRSKFVFFNTSSHMHHEADAVYSFMPCAELINPVNFFFLRAAFGIKRGCLNIGTPS